MLPAGNTSHIAEVAASHGRGRILVGRPEGLRDCIEASSHPERLMGLAKMWLDLAAEYIGDSVRLKDEIRPGRLIIVDLRDEVIERDKALALFVVLLQLFADVKYRDSQGEHSFNKLIVFDEALKYIESLDLMAGLIQVVRDKRHKETTIMVVSRPRPRYPSRSSSSRAKRFDSPQVQLAGVAEAHPADQRGYRLAFAGKNSEPTTWRCLRLVAQSYRSGVHQMRREDSRPAASDALPCGHKDRGGRLSL